MIMIRLAFICESVFSIIVLVSFLLLDGGGDLLLFAAAFALPDAVAEFDPLPAVLEFSSLL